MGFRKIFNRLLTICLLFLPFSLQAKLSPTSEITYGLSGGRLGDNLLSVAHAAWLSHTLGIPLTYTPFPYGDQLALSSQLKKPSCTKFCSLNEVSDYTTLWNVCLGAKTAEPLLITLPYFAESSPDLSSAPMAQVNWDDPDFIMRLRELISPIQPVAAPKLPENRTHVALHIRTGVGGIDERKFKEHWPLKTPPMSFYIDGLRTIWEMLKRPLYVFIFTDDPNPHELQNTLAKAFVGSDILFDCRKEGNRADKNVLEDFFTMGKFSCLIRPDSNYSLVASKIFPYQIVISPLSSEKNEANEVEIDRLLVQVNSADAVSKPVRTVVVKSSSKHDKKEKEKEKERRRKEKEKEKEKERKRKEEERKRKEEEKKRKKKHHHH